MPMAASTATTEVAGFMVPESATEPPPDGWPDGNVPPAVTPTEGTTTGTSAGPNKIAASGLTPGGFVDGYLSASPYWDGAKVTGNTATEVTVEKDATDPSGEHTADVVVGSDGQTTFALPGAPNIAEVRATVRVGDGFELGWDPAASNFAGGVVEVFDPEEPDNLLTGQTLRFTYTLKFTAGIPGGVEYTLVPPKPANAAPLKVGAAWAAAYKAMVAEGMAGAVPPGDLSQAETAMADVINGMMGFPSLVPLGLTPFAIAAGATAFWGVVAGSFAVVFPGSLAVVPPPALATLAVGLIAAGTAALAMLPTDPWTSAPAEACAALYGAALYAGTLGAIVVLQPGPVPVPFPFL